MTSCFFVMIYTAEKLTSNFPGQGPPVFRCMPEVNQTPGDLPTFGPRLFSHHWYRYIGGVCQNLVRIGTSSGLGTAPLGAKKKVDVHHMIILIFFPCSGYKYKPNGRSRPSFFKSRRFGRVPRLGPVRCRVCPRLGRLQQLAPRFYFPSG